MHYNGSRRVAGGPLRKSDADEFGETVMAGAGEAGRSQQGQAVASRAAGMRDSADCGRWPGSPEPSPVAGRLAHSAGGIPARHGRPQVQAASRLSTQF